MYFMANCSQLAVTRRAQSQLLMSSRTRPHRPEHLRPLKHQLHGPVGLLRRQRRQNHMRPHLPLAAKPSTHKEACHMNVLFRISQTSSPAFPALR